MPKNTDGRSDASDRFIAFLVDRDHELSQLESALSRARLIVITGPEGVGKSHLLHHATTNLVAGATVHLHLERGASLEQALQAALDSPDDSLEALTQSINDRALTLVIDQLENADSLTEAGVLLSNLLQHCRNLQVLAASITRPNVYGVVEIPLSPLRVPAPNETSVAEMRETPAVILWLQLNGTEPRAQEVRKAARRVRQLGGLPLAIVSDVQTPDATRKLLRQAAKRAFDRLQYTEQLLLATYSVFRGEWSLELAIRVLAPWMNADQVEVSLGRFVASSVVQRNRVIPNRVTFRMLPHLRTHGRYLLRKEGVLTEAELAHTDAMQSIARDAVNDAHTPNHMRWYSLIESVQDDMEAAWERLTRDSEHDAALEMVTNLWPYWRIAGALDRYRGGLEYSLHHSRNRDQIRVKALTASGIVHHLLGQWETSSQRHEEAIALAQSLEDPHLEGSAWVGYGDYGVQMGDFTLAENAYLEAEKIATRHDFMAGMAEVQLSLASLYRHQHRPRLAVQVAESALRWLSTITDLRGVAHAHAMIGRLRAELADEPRASFHLFRALNVAEEIQDQTVLAETLEGLAQLAALQHSFTTSTRLLGAASRRRTDTNNPGWATPPESLKLTIRANTAALGAQFDREFATGRKLGWEAVQTLIEGIPLTVSIEPPPVTLTEENDEMARIGLTRREREVLLLMAEGAQDREIAEALNIGIRTVHTHVHRVLSKFGVSSRAGAVATAWRTGILS